MLINIKLYFTIFSNNSYTTFGSGRFKTNVMFKITHNELSAKILNICKQSYPKLLIENKTQQKLNAKYTNTKIPIMFAKVQETEAKEPNS